MPVPARRVQRRSSPLRLMEGQRRVEQSRLIEQLSPFEHVQDPRLLRSVSKYVGFRKLPRLGRSIITNPFDFNKAESMALRNQRRAQSVFHSPAFQREFKRLPPEVKRPVLDEYRRILKEAAAIRLIAKKERLVHERTPAVYNRRAFDSLVFNRLSQPHKHAYSVGMIDLDYFGKVNKKFGQESGNVVLQRFSEELARECIKYGGFAGRVGGEEFQFYLPVDPRRAKLIVDNLRIRFARISSATSFRKSMQAFHEKSSQYFSALEGWDRPVLFTAGLTGESSLTKPNNRPGKLFSAADAAMQQGKKAGRARTVIARLSKAA